MSISLAYRNPDTTSMVPSDRFSDWTDLFDRSAAAFQANSLTDDLILDLHQKKLTIHRDLDARELALLYRFSFHVGVNIFIERLLRVAYSREMQWSQTFPDVYYQPRYFTDIDEAILTNYLDFALNYHYLHQIYKTLGGRSIHESGQAPEQPRPQDPFLHRRNAVREKVKSVLKRFIEIYAILTKPNVVGEYSNWMREVLPLRQMLSFHYPASRYPVDHKTREAIKDCCRRSFLRRIDDILPHLSDAEKTGLSELFAAIIDGIIPQSLVEGLTERWSYFEKLIKDWHVQQLHSFIGYYYNENFKIFAVLARRKGATLFGYAHGASNPKGRADYRNMGCELALVDYYFTWAGSDSNWLKGNRNLEHLKISSLGSTYLPTMPKWKKKQISERELTILYPSGPLVDFMTDLEEMATREKTLKHRFHVLTFIKEMMSRYPGTKILYKPFPGTFTNDPIKEILGKEMVDGHVRLVIVKPLKLYPKVDIVLWDCISTGFAESIQSEVPTLVFQSPHEYEESSPMGKAINQELMKCGMIFHDVESGLQNVHRIVNHLHDFMEKRKEAVNRFQESVAYPVTKKEFLKKWRLVTGTR